MRFRLWFIALLLIGLLAGDSPASGDGHYQSFIAHLIGWLFVRFAIFLVNNELAGQAFLVIIGLVALSLLIPDQLPRQL